MSVASVLVASQSALKDLLRPLSIVELEGSREAGSTISMSKRRRMKVFRKPGCMNPGILGVAVQV
jgi:hypothetical protein